MIEKYVKKTMIFVICGLGNTGEPVPLSQLILACMVPVVPYGT
jgi:hypothetical protein